MSAAIVFGCGATLNASETRYNIDEYFTDPAFNQFVRKYDSNSDGYLTDSEVLAGTHNGLLLEIDDENIKCLDGLEVLPPVQNLFIETGASKIDLSSWRNDSASITGGEYLKVVVCGRNTKDLRIRHSSNLKSVYLNYAKSLEFLALIDCPTLAGNLSLENSPKLDSLYVNETNIKNIYCSDEAKLLALIVEDTPLRTLDISGTGCDDYRYIEISTNKTLTNIYAKGDLARFLWENGLFRPNEYLFYNEIWSGNHIYINNTGEPIEFEGRMYN